MEVYFNGGKQVFADINGFTVKTDQSPRGGGEGLYPEPFTIFLASLGTCAGIYVKGFCDSRGLATESIKLTQDLQYDPIRRMVARFIINIHVPADFPDKYDDALIRSASQCAVKKHLHPDIELETKVLRN
jgi:ribosomal protein S12 methylthiotransferase accessory factor